VGQNDDCFQAEVAPIAHCSDLSWYRSGCCSTPKIREEQAEELGELDHGEHERQEALGVTMIDYDQQRDLRRT
jgi:hypothetical protein